MLENSIIFIGAGKCSKWVAEQVDLDVLGFYDIDTSKSTFASLDDAINADADIYAICTPSSEHINTYNEIAPKLDNKIITIEKPTFLRLKDFDIDTYNHKVYPVFQHRYTTPNIDVGEIYHAQARVNWCRPQRYYDLADWRGTWQHDGGVLTNQGIHTIDIIRYLLGDIKEVVFRMDTAAVDIEVEDTALGILTTESGILVNVVMTTTCRPNNQVTDLTIYGSKKYQTINIPDDYGTGHKIFYDKLSKGAIIQSMSDAKKTMDVIHAAYKSSYGKSMLGENV